jgi:hypothetical protein
MRADFQIWLEQQDIDAATVAGQLNRAGRIEKAYGNLDKHYAKDRLQNLIEILRYSPEDERKRRPNPTKLRFEGNIRNNLSLYRYVVEQYRRFRDGEADVGAHVSADEPEPGASAPAAVDDEGRQRSVLERDMQAAVRADIGQLEPGLEIIDNGLERSVESGSIPITARDRSGAIVVIDLRGTSVGRRAVAQVLSFMGDIAGEEPEAEVRGILVGSGFEKNARAAARMAPSLSLRTYSLTFRFSPVAASEDFPGQSGAS